MKDNRWQLAEKWSNGICTWSATKFRIKLLQSLVKWTRIWWWRWTVTVVLSPTRLRWGGGDGEWIFGRKYLFRRLTKQSRTKSMGEISLNVVIMKGLGLNKNLHYRSLWASVLWRQMRFGLQDQKSCMDTKVVAFITFILALLPILLWALQPLTLLPLLPVCLLLSKLPCSHLLLPNPCSCSDLRIQTMIVTQSFISRLQVIDYFSC